MPRGLRVPFVHRATSESRSWISFAWSFLLSYYLLYPRISCAFYMERCNVNMAPDSIYMRPPLIQDNSSSSTLDVSVPLKKKFVRRPPVRTSGDDSSSTLDGREKVLRKKKSTTIESIIDMYGERPLPPVPRIPSSIYSFSRRSPTDSPVSPETPQTTAAPLTSPPSPLTPVRTRLLTEKDLKAAKHLSQPFTSKALKPKSVSKIPEALPIHLSSARDGDTLKEVAVKAQPPKSVKPIPFTEWKAPAYQEPQTPSKISPRSALSQRSSSFDSPRSHEPKKTADGRAASYFAVIHHTKATTFERGPYNLLFSKTPSPPLPLAFTKKLSKPTLPYPLRTSSLPERPPHTSSHFSLSSPNASDDNSITGVAKTLRHRAKKTFLQSKTPKRPTLKQRMDSDPSNVSPMTTRPISMHRPHTRPKSRNSMQRGLLDMYNTLQNISSLARRTSVKPKEPRRRADSIASATKMLTKELRSPAIALTEYQKHGAKAWDDSKKTTYLKRMPRQRLSKPQFALLSTRPQDIKFAEGQSPATPDRSKSTKPIRSDHLLRSFTDRPVRENRLSKQERNAWSDIVYLQLPDRIRTKARI